MIRHIEFIPKYHVDNSFLNTLYGKSILTVSESSLESLYSIDPTIERIELYRDLPLSIGKIDIKLNFYEQVAAIYDLRGSQPEIFVLFKNLYTSESIEASKNALSVTIVNGPVDSGFNGEIVALYMTLSSFEKIDTSSLELIHSGTSIVGSYKDVEILFGSPVDLATKAAAVGELLSDESCQGAVRFISAQSFVSDCNI
tara:strand:+ start:1074 stop:1670 length:597 start_codon:yes stop_codon:yes gene_type:complete